MEYGELEFTKRVGSGGYGVVFKGSWNTKKSGKLLVAIKNIPLGDLSEVCVCVMSLCGIFIRPLSDESLEFTAASKLHPLLRLCLIKTAPLPSDRYG